MSTVAADLTSAAAEGPFAGLLEAYTRSLDLSREYVRSTVDRAPAAGDGDDYDGLDLDLDSLEHFLTARADLFAVAEGSLGTLTAADDPERRAVTKRVRAILEEMAEIEDHLSVFLRDRLDKMRDTIGQLQKARPVFTRYAHLGAHIHPTRITRHE